MRHQSVASGAAAKVCHMCGMFCRNAGRKPVVCGQVLEKVKAVGGPAVKCPIVALHRIPFSWL